MSAPAWPDPAVYGTGNSGIPYVWSFAADTPGPHLVVSALVHGNEPCGASAVCRMLDMGIRPRRGRLTLLLAHVEAYKRFRSGAGAAARFLDRDLNRLWRDDWIDADATSREAERARQLRPVLAGADALIDLHSTASVAQPFFVLADLEKSRRLADAMAWPPMQQLMPGGCGEGRHLIDYGRFFDPLDPAAAVTVECGRHTDRESSAAVALRAALLFLESQGAIEPRLDPLPAEPVRRFRTAAPYSVRSGDFRMLVSTEGFVAVARGQQVAVDGGVPVRAPFDAIIIAPRPAPAAGTTAFLWAREIS